MMALQKTGYGQQLPTYPLVWLRCLPWALSIDSKANLWTNTPLFQTTWLINKPRAEVLTQGTVRESQKTT